MTCLRTKRAMIAALYYRAGEFALIEEEHPDTGAASGDAAFTLRRAADAMLERLDPSFEERPWWTRNTFNGAAR